MLTPIYTFFENEVSFFLNLRYPYIEYKYNLNFISNKMGTKYTRVDFQKKKMENKVVLENGCI